MKNKYIVGYEEKNRQGFKPTFINVKAFDDIKEAYLFWYELKTEKNSLAYILDKESGRRFYYIYEIRELFPQVELTPDTKIKEWYANYSPEDYQLDKIRDDITFQNLVDGIKEGKDWNSIISVDQTSLDSIIREVLFIAAAEAVGITEDELYRLWLKEDYCEDLNEEYDDTNSDDFGNKIAYLANDEIEAIKGYETAIELFTNDYGVDNKDTIIDKLKEIEDEEKHHLDELKELYKLITGEEMVEIEDEPLEKEPEQLEENLSTNDFLDWHENYYKKDSGFDKKIEQVYTILDKYGKEDEDVDKVYEKCSDEDKEKITKIIKFETLKEDYNPIDYDLLNKIADRYNTSSPVSGDWYKEAEHELNAIANELDITKAKAKALMIDKLGFEEDQFDFPIIEGKLSNEDKKYNSFRIAQLLDRQLDDGTGNIRVDSLDPSKIVLSTNIKDKDDEKLAEYIQRIEKFFSDIGFEATKEFNVRPDNETIKVIFTYKDIYDEGKDIDPLDEGLKGPDFLEFIELCKKLGFEKLTDVEEFKEKSNIQSDQDLLNALRDKLKNKLATNESLDETIEKKADTEYKGYIIEHFPYSYIYGDEQEDVEGYIIQSPYYLSNGEEKRHLPFHCENEEGEVINFDTLEDAKSYIDKYMSTKKGKMEIKHGNEVHFVINDLDEDLNTIFKVGDCVIINTPNNETYNGRKGIIDYIDTDNDGRAKIIFKDDKKPSMNLFDLKQIQKCVNEKPKNESLERLQEWNIFPEDPKEDKIQEWVYAKWEDSKDYLDEEEYDYLERAIYEAEKGKMTWRELANQYFEYSEDEIELDDDEDLEDYPQPNPDEDDYDPVHEKEWMEKHPDGWYNNEHDYGYDDENGVKRYMGGNLKENYFIIQNSRGKNMSKPSKQSDKLWEQLDAMEAQGLKNLKIVKYSMNKEGNK